MKAVLRVKFTVITLALKKQDLKSTTQFYNLRNQKNKKKQLKASRRKEILKHRIDKINETKSWFSEKNFVNKTDNLLATWIKKKKAKLLKLEMKVGILLLILQKNKGL